MKLRIKTYLPFYIIGVTALSLVVLRVVWANYGPPLIINYTSSEPYGFYWIKKHKLEDYKEGMLVVFPVPEAYKDVVYGRQWVSTGLPLIKGVGAIKGKNVCMNNERLYIDNQYVAKIFLNDSAGRPLPKQVGCKLIKDGEFFPLSTYIEKSFDGRYIGPQQLSSIIGEAKPIWTF